MRRILLTCTIRLCFSNAPATPELYTYCHTLSLHDSLPSSIETASDTSSSDPWTDAQVEELIELGVWMHQHHGIPLRMCRTHDDPGFGYHRLHSKWSTRSEEHTSELQSLMRISYAV